MDENDDERIIREFQRRRKRQKTVMLVVMALVPIIAISSFALSFNLALPIFLLLIGYYVFLKGNYRCPSCGCTHWRKRQQEVWNPATCPQCRRRLRDY